MTSPCNDVASVISIGEPPPSRTQPNFLSVAFVPDTLCEDPFTGTAGATFRQSLFCTHKAASWQHRISEFHHTRMPLPSNPELSDITQGNLAKAAINLDLGNAPFKTTVVVYAGPVSVTARTTVMLDLCCKGG